MAGNSGAMLRPQPLHSFSLNVILRFVWLIRLAPRQFGVQFANCQTVAGLLMQRDGLVLDGVHRLIGTFGHTAVFDRQSGMQQPSHGLDVLYAPLWPMALAPLAHGYTRVGHACQRTCLGTQT